MPLLDSRTNQLHRKRKSESDRDGYYVQSLRELLRHNKNKDNLGRNQLSQSNVQYQSEVDHQQQYPNNHKKSKQKQHLQYSPIQQTFQSDDENSQNQQTQQKILYCNKKLNNDRRKKKKRYSIALRQENPEQYNLRKFNFESDHDRNKLPRVHRNTKNQSIQKREAKRKKFKTIDRELIQNYMNAILIEVQNTHRKHAKPLKRIKPKPKNINVAQYSSPPPINTLNSPKSLPIHKAAVTPASHKFSSRTQDFESERAFTGKNHKKSRSQSISGGYFLPHPRFQKKMKNQVRSIDRSNDTHDYHNNIYKSSMSSEVYPQNKNERRKQITQKQEMKKIEEDHEKQQIYNSSHCKSLKNQSWLKIDPLQLQTYFFKLKNKKIRQQQIYTEMKRLQFTIPEVPEKDCFSTFIKQYVPENKDIKIPQLLRKPTFQIIYEQTPESKKYLYFGETMPEDCSIKEGFGILVTERFVFEGQWKGDVKIQGVQKSKQGLYKGYFKNNKRQGEGQFHWSHGEYYSGQWKEGKKSGSGYWKSSSGQSYMGEWSDGQVNGYGVHTMKNGRKYEGQFINFLKHGSGKQIFPNGDNYEGKYIMGQPHGKGTYYWKSGYIYEGMFFQGFREGEGKLTLQKKMQFQGRFLRQKADGFGKMKYQNGDYFQGEYKESKRNGEGILKLKYDQKIIKGIWKENQIIKNKEEIEEQL